MTVLFGIDVGTSATKGLAVDPEDGRILATEEAPYPLSTPRPGWSEQDPEDWWRATETVLERLTKTAGAPAGIGLSGQMHGLVALGANDEVLRPAILWNDQRTQAECEEIESTIGLHRLINLTGNRALAGFTAPKVLWLRNHEPDVYKQINRIALPKDYVRLRLTGEHDTDVSDASGTLLLDVANRSWSDEVLTALDFDPAWLPSVHESPEIAGETKDGTPVAAGAGDQAAGALGVGVDRKGPVSVAVGTSGVVFAALDTYAADRQARVHAFCHAVPQTWHAMGVMLSAAGSLAWLRNTVGPDSDYTTLLNEAADWPAGTENLIFLPYLAGERTPYPDPEAKGAFVGLSVRHDRGALTRAVLEGVAFGLKDSLDLTEDLGGVPELGRISGGGSRSDLWTKIIASALELPLERVAVDEGAAFGAAILAGVAAGVWPDVHAGVAATVRPRERIEPVPEWVDIYKEQRSRYRALYPALRTVG
ncbi:MAG: xylulokinase [Solirubrobacterales bacterium]|nr:xylulokinase [Solirubrobacterales bacterium]